MSDLNIQIRTQLEVVLGKRPGDLAAAIMALDDLRGRAGGHLAHYLGNRSYQKAWTYLQGGQPEKGICGGRR